jgi:hypothetical protein
MFDFLRTLITFFDKYNIPYMLSGSMAMSTYTGPRYTRDFDFVVHLKPSDAFLLSENFKDGYYCDEDTITEAIERESMFNIIDHKSNYKADFVILKSSFYRRTEFERRKTVDFLDMKIFLVSPEDLLISKLIWIQEIQSSVQIDDIKMLSVLEGLDWIYINYWIRELKLNTFGIVKND